MQDYKISPFDFSDISEIEFICRRHLETPGIWIADYSYSQAELLEEINRIEKIYDKNGLVTLIAKTKSEIIGFIWAEKIIDQPNSLYITSLWTAPDYRKQGIATMLKLELENIAKIKGYTKIKTNVYTPNTSMLYLNLKLGYNIVSYDLEKSL